MSQGLEDFPAQEGLKGAKEAKAKQTMIKQGKISAQTPDMHMKPNTRETFNSCMFEAACVHTVDNEGLAFGLGSSFGIGSRCVFPDKSDHRSSG